MKRLLLILSLVLVVPCGHMARAHEVRPAYLELRPVGPNLWNVLWKVPAMGQSLRLGVSPRLPNGCHDVGLHNAGFMSDAHVERWLVACPAGLSGGIIYFDGLGALQTDVLLRIEGIAGQRATTARILPTEPSFLVPEAASMISVIDTYLRLGVHHILIGADHLLFLLSLLLIVRGWQKLLATITAFTIGHTITLASVTLGGIAFPGPPVEAAIALSITCAAAEATLARRGDASVMSRLPWVMALGFGLLHGLGFAGALREIGLPEQAILPALFFFNVGIEVGQIVFVAVILFLAVSMWWLVNALRGRASAAINATRAEIIASYAIGIVGAYWLVERLETMLT